MRMIFDLPSVFADQIRTAESEANRVYEPMIGIVTDNKDPKKLGRVKIKIPVLHASETTWWAPIVMLGAGKNRGWFFIPEIEDEVLVMFEHGDMDRPLVVGALWNGKDKPPDQNPGSNPRRVIKSRAGSRIIFDDEHNTLTIEDGAGIGVITFEADSNTITIEAKQGDVCFQAPAGDVQIAAKTATFTATNNVELHAGTSIAIGSDSKIDVKGGQSMTISGSTANANGGGAQMPQAPTPAPEDVSDPYGS
jgi:uncharacterized protein involved in type VI secretion and phage assembly